MCVDVANYDKELCKITREEAMEMRRQRCAVSPHADNKTVGDEWWDQQSVAANAGGSCALLADVGALELRQVAVPAILELLLDAYL